MAGGPEPSGRFETMRVRAPGSSANIGPGFDVLGLSVARYVWANDDGEGTHCWPEHIARIAYEEAGGKGDLWFDFELEPSRGLGFSAAARAAGAMLANLQAGYDVAEAQHRAYEVVAEIEGHGDNAAPCVFGGMFIIAGDVYHRLSGVLPGNLLFWVPDLETSTDHSRLNLTTEVPRADAIFNLGRLGLLMAAVYEQRLDLLATATQDRLHQPPRFIDCEPAAKAYEIALQAGAAAAWLSGSGPTVGIVVDDASKVAVTNALAESGVVHELAVDEVGAMPV